MNLNFYTIFFAFFFEESAEIELVKFITSDCPVVYNNAEFFPSYLNEEKHIEIANASKNKLRINF